MTEPVMFELRLDISIQQVGGNYGSGGNLRISETHAIAAENFLELASILHEFHELAKSLAKK